MKYARKSAATTRTGTTIEVTKTTAAFVDRLVVLLHLLLSESYLKYKTSQGQKITETETDIFQNAQAYKKSNILRRKQQP